MRHTLWTCLAIALTTGCDRTTPPVAETPVRQAAFITTPSAGIDLGSLGGPNSYASDINDPGVVVGYSETPSRLVHAFRWTAQTGMTDLGTLPGGKQSGAIRILNSGQILGWSETDGGGRVPVRWSASGQIQNLRIPSHPDFVAVYPADFNQRGEVIGTAVGEYEHGWYWSKATGTIDLRDRVPSCFENAATAINASGLVTGGYCAPAAGWLHAFTWRLRGAYTDLGVGDDIQNANGVGLAINNAGTVAGWLDPHGNIYPNATLWNRGRGYTLLPNLSAAYPSGYATSVNNRGIAVGASFDEAGDRYVPVAWPTPGTLVRLDGGVPQAAVATAVNESGMIVGSGVVNPPGPNRALLWRLASGRAESIVSLGGAARLLANAAPIQSASTGPEGCLADRRAITSKAALADCVMLRR